MESNTNSNHLRFMCSVFMAFMLFLACILYTIIALQRQMLWKCLWCSLPPLPPLSPLTLLLTPAASVHPDELTFWYCSRDLLKASRASWKSTQGFPESSWLHSEAERKCLPSFSCWMRWGWKFLSIKRRWIILNFMCNFHLSDLWKSLFLCLLQTKKTEMNILCPNYQHKF